MAKFLILRIDQGGLSKPGPGRDEVEFHFPVITGKTVEQASDAAIDHLRRAGRMPRHDFGRRGHFAEWFVVPEFIRPEGFIL